MISFEHDFLSFRTMKFFVNKVIARNVEVEMVDIYWIRSGHMQVTAINRWNNRDNKLAKNISSQMERYLLVFYIQRYTNYAYHHHHHHQGPS